MTYLAYALLVYITFRATRFLWWAWRIDHVDYLPMHVVQREVVKQSRREGRLG